MSLIFSGVSKDQIISEYFSPDENIQVIGFEDPFKLLAYCLRCKTFFVSDMSNYGVPETVINLWYRTIMKNIGVLQNKKTTRKKILLRHQCTMKNKPEQLGTFTSLTD